MKSFKPGEAELVQLRVLSIWRARSQMSSVDAKSALLDEAILGGQLMLRGLVGCHQQGWSPNRFWWLTSAGAALLAGVHPPEIRGHQVTHVFIDELAYDAASDAAEQIP